MLHRTFCDDVPPDASNQVKLLYPSCWEVYHGPTGTVLRDSPPDDLKKTGFAARPMDRVDSGDGRAAGPCSGSVGSSGSDASQVADDIGSVGPMFDGENQAPDFELVLYGNENHSPGERLRLSDLKGKPVVVNFWFPSCPPCRAEMPDLEASFREHRADGVEFIGVQLVGLDSAEDGQKFVDEIGVTYALGADEGASITRDFQVTSFPTTVFLDREHRIVREWGGILTADKLEELVQEALAPADAEMT